MTELALRVGQASLRFGQRPAGPAHWEASLGLRYKRLAGQHYHGGPAPVRDVALEEAGAQLTPRAGGRDQEQSCTQQRLPAASRERRPPGAGNEASAASPSSFPGSAREQGQPAPPRRRWRPSPPAARAHLSGQTQMSCM